MSAIDELLLATSAETLVHDMSVTRRHAASIPLGTTEIGLMSLDDLPNLTISAIAIVLSLFAYRASIHQNRLSASSVGADWIRDLREWASEAVDVLAEASYCCLGSAPMPTAQTFELQHRCKLSALVDRGRFLLPNERDHEYGSHKPRAYRGLRHQALDALVGRRPELC